MGTWNELTYTAVVDTMYKPQNISIIETTKAPKQADQLTQKKNNPLQTFWKLLQTSVQMSGVKTELFSSASVVSPGTVKIYVTDEWHYLHKQQRLQMAQSVWEMWARIYSPQNLDKSRVSLVDSHGNEVGGSRVWAGSLIWVQD